MTVPVNGQPSLPIRERHQERAAVDDQQPSPGLTLEPTLVEPFLLRGDRYEDCFRQHSVDFQNRFRHRLRALPAEEAEPAIVVFTAACDAEVDRLSLELGLRNIPLYRIDAEDCVGRKLAMDPVAGMMSIDGNLVRPQCVWIRHFTAGAILVGDQDPVVRRYVQDQWTAVLDVVREWPTIQVNPASARRTSRLGQLRLAVELGIPVPPTVVASSAGEASTALGCAPEELLAKVNGDHFVQHIPGKVTGVFPRRVTPPLPVREPVPLLFQRFVPHDREVRVFSVEEELFGYEVRKNDPRDVWAEPDAVEVTAIEVPACLRKPVQLLLARTGLTFSGFDFLITPEDNPVFLEYNVNGDWAWFERAADDERVSRAALRHFTRVLGRGSPV